MHEAIQNPQKFYNRTMPEVPDAVRPFYVGLSSRDNKKLRSVLSDDFTFISPMEILNSPEEYIAMVSAVEGWVETERFIMEDNAVAHMFTLHMIEPAVADIAVVDIFTIEGGSITSVRAYNNPADFPSPPE